MKKILILTVTAGGGHNSAAQAMRQKLEAGGSQVKIVDMFAKFASAYRRTLVDSGYCLSVAYFRRLYNYCYEKCRKYSPLKEYNSSEHGMVKGVYGGLLKLIYDFRPDVIYCTSFHCAVAIANLKRAFPIFAKTVTVMLDYVISPYWECAAEGVDLIGVPDSSFGEELIGRGYKLAQIKKTGIPVKAVNGLNREQARRALGFNDDKFTVLIMFGGGYWKGAYAAFKAIAGGVKKPLRLIVVNGADKKGWKKVERSLGKLPAWVEVVNLGYSDSVPSLMLASDVMVGKGGGLTVTESINCHLPLIATAKLAGQECYNVEYLVQKGAAATYRSGRELAQIVNSYMEETARLESMRLKLSELTNNGLGELAALITELPEADYSQAPDVDYSQVNRIVESKRKAAYRQAKASLRNK